MAHVKSRAPRERAQSGFDPATAPFYEGLINATSRDVALSCNRSDTELERDLEEIRTRFRNEGMSFLTKTLPSLGKALDRALSRDTALDPTGFKARKGTKIPLFMGELFSQVFSDDGLERSDASDKAVMAIRQVCFLFYKLNLPFTQQQEDDVVNLFVETDEALANNTQALLESPCQWWIIRYAKSLIQRILAPVDPLCRGLFHPKHGPGGVSTGEKAWQKPLFKRYIARLASVFPYEEYFYYNHTHLCDDLISFYDLEEIDAGTAKVVLVPKDSRGPRLISCEPLENQWIQQGLMRALTETVSNHPLTKGLVNFTDQTVNQRLAIEGSLNGSHATLDMKDASDRVGLALVKALFPSRWFDALWASRSDATKLPNGDIRYMKKFAPMGSAVCFPVEALVFWALSVAAISYESGRSYRALKAEGRAPYVYGDDIICAIQDYGCIEQYLPKFDLMLNPNKCCVGKSYRESCGVDAFKGVIVTPLRAKATWSSSLTGMSYLSWVAFHNAAMRRGYFNLCDYLAVEIQQARKTPYSDDPLSETIALVDCRKVAAQENKRLGFRTRFNYELHRLEIRSWTVRFRMENHAELPGWAEMLRIASLSREMRGLNPANDTEGDTRQITLLAAPGRRYYHPKFDVERWVRRRLPVRAYQYPESRQASLARDWTRL